jgi:hypothetical protein
MHSYASGFLVAVAFLASGCASERIVTTTQGGMLVHYMNANAIEDESAGYAEKAVYFVDLGVGRYSNGTENASYYVFVTLLDYHSNELRMRRNELIINADGKLLVFPLEKLNGPNTQNRGFMTSARYRASREDLLLIGRSSRIAIDMTVDRLSYDGSMTSRVINLRSDSGNMERFAEFVNAFVK